MNFPGLLKNLVGYVIMALAFSLPFGRRYTAPLFIAWMIFSVALAIVERKTIGQEFKLKPKPAFTLLLLPFAYYMLVIAGLAMTTDMRQGTFELEKKISFFAVPMLAFFFLPFATVQQIKNILLAFCLGLTTTSLISISLGFYR
jgi:hypothetical protein